MAVTTAQAQNSTAEQLLLQNYLQAATDSEKVYSLYPLINYYYAFNNETKADSLRELQLMAAEESRSQSLMLNVLFPVYSNSLSGNSSNLRFNKEMGFANQALEFAKSISRNEYVALAYANIGCSKPEQRPARLRFKECRYCFYHCN